jgi:hypothetical protein
MSDHLSWVWVTKYESLCTQLLEKVCNMKYYVCKKHIALLQFSFPCVTFPLALQLFLIFFGTGFEVPKLVRIYNVVCVRTPCSLVHGLWMFCRSIWICPHRPLEDGGNMSWLNPWYPPVRLHGPITRKTIILNLNIMHFPCILSLSYILKAG